MLTQKEIEEFKRITFEIKGLKLTDEQALDQGLRTIILFDLFEKVRKNNVASYQAKSENK